jgi:hypothetical protein
MQKTTDYSIFSLRLDNRPTMETHTKRIVKSIQNKNMLHLRPISVNEDMEVIDGQYRLEAAKRLGVPIYYEIIEEYEIKDVLDLNVLKMWNTTDYLNYFCQHNIEPYIKLKKFLEETGCSISQLFSLIGVKSSFKYEQFRTGKYIFDLGENSETIKKIENLKAVMRSICGSDKFFNSVRLFKSLCRIVNHEDYLEEKMVANMHRLSDKIGPRATEKQYLKTFVEIYNYRNNNKISFTILESSVD